MSQKFLLVLGKDHRKPFNYSSHHSVVKSRIGGNTGNIVFEFALQSALKDKCYDVRENGLGSLLAITPEEINYINENYSSLVLLPANIISIYMKDMLPLMTKLFHQIKIPVHVISAGAQSCNSYSTTFITEIKNEAYDFFKLVLNNRGKIGLRGFFSHEVFNQLGFSYDDAKVIGCISMMAKGRDLQVNKKEVSMENFNLTTNGFRLWNDVTHRYIFTKYPRSTFVDQDEFYKLLYLPDALTWKECQYLADSTHHWLKLYLNNRIKIYCDFLDWYNDLKNEQYHFSFGCRIHGNIMSLLAGIPAYIDAFDSRTRELAEYFNIPNSFFPKGYPDPYNLFCHTDYTKFNNTFKDKYDTMYAFLSDIFTKDCLQSVDIDSLEYTPSKRSINTKFVFNIQNQVI